jgi:hypothetical protein
MTTTRSVKVILFFNILAALGAHVTINGEYHVGMSLLLIALCVSFPCYAWHKLNMLRRELQKQLQTYIT